MAKLSLVVVAHPDDEILGFGATGAKLAARGEGVQPVVLCGTVDVRSLRPQDDELEADITRANALVGFQSPILGDFPNVRMNTVGHVELVQFIELQIERFRPARVFTHHPGDLNDDHGQVARACLAACRLFQRRGDVAAVESVHFMEIPSATDWAMDASRLPFVPNHYSDIVNEFDRKLEALSCYRGVMREHPHPRSQEALRGLAAYRGGQCGFRLAEAFQTVFMRDVL